MHRIQVTIGATDLISTYQLEKMAYVYVSDRDLYHNIVNKTFAANNPKIHWCQFINRQ